jgi:hypothetical protein
MPCDSGPWIYTSDCDPEARERIDDLAAVLCCICDVLEATGAINDVLTDDRARAWWERHKAQDAQRKGGAK